MPIRLQMERGFGHYSTRVYTVVFVTPPHPICGFSSRMTEAYGAEVERLRPVSVRRPRGRTLRLVCQPRLRRLLMSTTTAGRWSCWTCRRVVALPHSNESLMPAFGSPPCSTRSWPRGAGFLGGVVPLGVLPWRPESRRGAPAPFSQLNV